MPAIQIYPDRFAARSQLQNDPEPASQALTPHIRRPTRGTVLKEDSFATLRVVAGDGGNINLVDAGGRRTDQNNQFFEIDGKRATDIYSNFFIQQIQEERAEKQQILETFGEAFIFLYGERARMMTFSGVLLNTLDFNWEGEWWHNYDNYMRGTRCVENNAQVFLSFDDTLVTGYIIGSAATKNSQDKNFVNFQFQMFIVSYTNFSNIGNPNAAPDGLGEVGKELSFTADQLRAFRPSIIDTSTQTGSVNSFSPAGILDQPTLEQGLLVGLSAVAGAIKTVRLAVNTALQNLSNLVNGEVVRVPVGFAGTMEFDDDVDIASLQEVTGAGVVKYSTYDKNDDEYVGVSDHYGSSISTTGVVHVLPSSQDIANSNLERDQGMVSAATAIWQENGFTVPPDQQGTLETFMLRTGTGLVSMGATAAWQNKTLTPGGTLTTVASIARSSHSLPVME